MAAPELREPSLGVTRRSRDARRPGDDRPRLEASRRTGTARGVRTACTRSYALIWAATGLAAAAVHAGGGSAARAVRGVLQLQLRSTVHHPHTLASIATLTAHNLPIASWPLLLALAGADSSRAGRAAGDTLVLVGIAANTLPVGAALGAYGSALVAYVPQLPVEWAALALGAAAWILERQRPLTRRERLTWLAAITACVLAAAALETTAVPSG